MNILYIDHYAGSTSMGMEFRPYYFAQEWQKMGHKVRIVAANYSHLRKTNPVVNKDFEIQNIDGVEFQWIKTRRYEGNGVKRAISVFQFCVKLWLYAKKLVASFEPDIVIASSTYPLDTYPAQQIKKWSRKTGNKVCIYVHEGHDIWPLTLTEIGGISSKNPFVLLLSIAEHSAYMKSDKIVSVLPNSVEHMSNCGLKDIEKFSYIPNGVVSEDWNNNIGLGKDVLPQQANVLDELRANGKFIVGYVGGHALSNALDTLIDAACVLRDRTDISFVLVGEGTEKQSLIERARDNDLSNVYFVSSVMKQEIPNVLNRMDAVYVALKNSSLYKYGVCLNKLYDYMMAGKPIIYGVNAYNDEVSEANAGITIEADDKEKLVEAILTIKNMDLDQRIAYGNNGKNWVLDNREYGILSKKFLDNVIS